MSVDVAARFFSAGNDLDLNRAPKQLRDAVEPWLARMRTDRGPVAFLPRLKGTRLWWYGIAPDAKGRRELLGLLDSWIGPTYSDLPLSRGRLDLSDPFDGWLGDALESRVLRFEVLPSEGANIDQARTAVRRLLRALDQLITDRPPSAVTAPRPSSEILDDLGHAISALDGGLAERFLEELRDGADLDETNLAFQRLRVLAGFERWQDVLGDRSLRDLLELRRPPGVSRVIQRAVYEVHLSVLDRQERDRELAEAAEDVFERFEGLMSGSPEPRSRPEMLLQFLAALRTTTEGGRGWMDRLLQEAEAIDVGMSARLERLRRSIETQVEPIQPTDPFEEAQARYWAGDAIGALEVARGLPAKQNVLRLAVLAAADIGTSDAARNAIDLLEAAGPGVRETLQRSSPLRAALSSLDGLVQEGAPRDWGSWFARIADGAARDDAIRWVQEVSEEWPTLEAARLLQMVGGADDKTLAVVGEVAGTLLSAHAASLRPEDIAAIAHQILEALALSGRTSAGVRVQALNLADLLLAGEPSAPTVTAALEALTVLTAAMASSATIDWMVDVLETVTYYPVPQESDAARIRFVHDTMSHLRRMRTSLDRVQLEGVSSCLASIGMDMPGDLEQLRSLEVDREADRYSCLSGQHVVIYSLMESASRRAAETLRRLVPTVRVETTAEHVGTDHLADLSRNADVFVVVTAAAKHAATDFIESNRAGPLMLINSKGASALLRGLAEVCAE